MRRFASSPAKCAVHWLGGSGCYATAYKPLYGAPVDQRLRLGHGKRVETFDRAMACALPVERPMICCDGLTLRAYLATGRFPEAVRPLLILNNGYDATLAETGATIALLRRCATPRR